MTCEFNERTHPNIQVLVSDLMKGLGLDLNFTYSTGFTVELRVNPDGRSVAVRASSDDQGPNNPFASTDDGCPLLGRPVVIRGDDMNVTGSA